MPMYEYRCQGCNEVFSAYKKLADYRTLQPHACGHIASRIISKPMIAVDFPAYVSPATGKLIEGKRQHMEDLKRSGCRLLEPGERTDLEKRKQQEDYKLEKAVDTTVEKLFSQIKG